jgi:hypothetical protein
MSRSRWTITLFAVLFVGIVIGGGGTVFYLRDRATVKPEPTTTSDVVRNFDLHRQRAATLGRNAAESALVADGGRFFTRSRFSS